MPFRVNNQIQINSFIYSTNSYTALTPCTAVGLNNGNFIVVWQSSHGDTGQEGSYGIYGQIFTNRGARIGNEFLINSYTAKDQLAPTLASLSNGKFVVIWQSAQQDGSGYGIYGQLFNNDGTRLGNEFRVNNYTTADQKAPAIAKLSTGDFIVVWQSTVPSGTQGQYASSIRGQLFRSDGSYIGTEFQINSNANDYTIAPSIAALGNDSFVVIWQNFVSQTGYSIHGQLFTNNGAKAGNEFQLNFTNSDPLAPSIASLSNGEFIITWQQFIYASSTFNLYGQTFTKDGIQNGNQFQVNTYNTNDKFPSVIGLDNDQFVITWQSIDANNKLRGVYGQLYANNATSIGDVFQVNTDATAGQHPNLANLGNGQFIITWQSIAQDGLSYGLFAQLFSTVPIVNRPPLLINPLPDQTVIADTPFDFIIPANTFIDPDGDPLIFTANSEPNNSLPSWINFDASALTFKGTSQQTGINRIVVSAHDPSNLAANSSFSLTINPKPITPTALDNSLISTIVGATAGGVALLTAGILAGICFWRRNKTAEAKASTNAQITEIEEIHPVSDNNATHSSSETISSTTKESIEELLIEAQEQLDFEEWNSALAIYEQILKIQQHPKALIGKGKALENLGELKQAIELYTMASQSENANKREKAIAEQCLINLNSKTPGSRNNVR